MFAMLLHRVGHSTVTTPTDFRALCAELLTALEIQLDELRFNNRLCLRARAALDETKPNKSCAVDPIRLSERKPGPEDMDGGLVWAGSKAPGLQYWEWCIDDVYAPCSTGYTHWLPASIKYLPARVEGPSDAEIAKPDHFVDVPKMVEPDDGEVAELVAWLRRHADIQEAAGTHWAQQFTRAADLLERLAPQPVPEEPTNQEIEEWAAASSVPGESLDPDSGRWERCLSSEEFCATVRAVLARWGQP